MDECKFCKDVEFWKVSRNKMMSRYKNRYFVKLSIWTWLKNEKALKKNVRAMLDDGIYKLNYCPVCGKEMKF